MDSGYDIYGVVGFILNSMETVLNVRLSISSLPFFCFPFTHYLGQWGMLDC